MKSVVISAVLVLTSAVISQFSGTGLIGCPNPGKIGNALTQLQQNNWRIISAERVMTIWPSRFDELACESDKGCRLLVSKNRVIGGHCECCEAFAFDVEPTADGSRSEHLNNIIIHFSARDKGTAIDAARVLARAAGLPEVTAAKVGADLAERYEWKDSREQIRQSYVLELRFIRADRNWELYLSLGAETI